MRKFYDTTTLPGAEALQALHVELHAEGVDVPEHFDAAMVVAPSAGGSCTFIQLYLDRIDVASYGAGFGVDKMMKLTGVPYDPREPLLIDKRTGRSLIVGDTVNVHNSGMRVLTGWYSRRDPGKSGYVTYRTQGGGSADVYASVIEAFIVEVS